MSQINDVITFAGSGLNWDDPLEYMPKGDSRWRLNVVPSERHSGNALANIKGTKERALINLPSGTNKVIGFCEDVVNTAGVYFLYNASGKHCILKYYALRDMIAPLIWSEPTLNFSDSHLIINPVVIGEMLFWTDGVNPPREINMVKAERTTDILYEGGIGVWVIEGSPVFEVS